MGLFSGVKDLTSKIPGSPTHPWSQDLIGTASLAIPGIGGYESQKLANNANMSIADKRNALDVAEAEKARQFSASQADINRAFEKEMSNSAVQRRMADLQAAGINPILAGKYDASSPAGNVGATAQAHPVAARVEPARIDSLAMLNGVMDVMKKGAEIRQSNAVTSLTNQKKDISDPLTSMMQMLQGVIESMTGGSNASTGLKNQVSQGINKLIEDDKKGAAIRAKPGIELTPYAEKRKKDLRYDKSKRKRRSNRHK